MSIETAGFAHVNLNCSALERSRPFFERALGLRSLVHTNPQPQDCSAFGLTVPGQWDAWMLGHTEAGAGCALDLLEWLRPRPLAAPAAPSGGLGFAGLGFEVPDLGAALARSAEAGGRAIAGEEPRGARVLDPDGVPLWLRQGSRSRLACVHVGCSDLERSLRFYDEVLGLKAVRDPQSAPGADAWLALPGDTSGFRVALSAWRAAERPRPAAKEPHQIGLFRMALLSADVTRAHAELRALGVPGLSAPADLDLGPACPAPGCRALFFRDPDGACLELIEVRAPAAGSP